ncbi:hypothetical protein B0H12DRAFT_1234932 [Mycena haematopus]|nr:hypothetical protein B0H12DRAFT_1234932 [Mycena haematopus]
MSSNHSQKRKPLSYMDIIRCFKELDTDFKDACKNLAQSTVQLTQDFDSISMRLHSLDLQAVMPPVKLQWQLIRKISAEQAAHTFHLVEKVIRLNSGMCNFHTEIARVTSQRASSGQRELQDLAQKILSLQNNVQNLFSESFKLSRPDATYVAFTAFRLISASGGQSSKAKLSRYPLVSIQNTIDITPTEELDGTRNEIAHAQYTTQISHRKSDALSKARTAISDLVPNGILMLEAALSLFTAIWLRLQTDSLDIFNWVQNNRDPPPCISAYLHGGYTVYSTLIVALDTYAEAIDLQRFNTTTH